jgi:PAS domain S-box-containing protein/putative nucleotidyltransferase with HDIG domain
VFLEICMTEYPAPGGGAEWSTGSLVRNRRLFALVFAGCVVCVAGLALAALGLLAQARAGSAGASLMPLAFALLASSAALLAGACGLLLRQRGGLLHQAEAASAFVRQLMDGMRDVVVIVSPREGRVLDANRAAEDLTGYPRGELLGKHVDTLRTANQPVEVGRSAPASYRVTGLRKDGSEVPLEVVTTVASVAGSPVYVSVGRDISAHLQVERRLEEANAALREATFDSMARLAAAMDLREYRTGSHSRRVSSYAGLIAHRLGLRGDELSAVRQAALLHDIGKIGVPDAVLLKPETLDDREWALMRNHTRIGADLLEGLRDFCDVREMVLTHHESWNGNGYPHGLRAGAIPLGSRIIAVADAFDAMANDRPYRSAQPFDRVTRELSRGSGGQFDPDVVAAMLAIAEPSWQNPAYAGAADLLDRLDRLARGIELGDVELVATLCTADVALSLPELAGFQAHGREELLRRLGQCLAAHPPALFELHELRFEPADRSIALSWRLQTCAGQRFSGQARVRFSGGLVRRVEPLASPAEIGAFINAAAAGGH